MLPMRLEHEKNSLTVCGVNTKDLTNMILVTIKLSLDMTVLIVHEVEEDLNTSVVASRTVKFDEVDSSSTGGTSSPKLPCTRY